MTNEIKELQRKVREVAKKQEEEVLLKKEELKKRAQDLARQEKEKLEKEINKENINHSIFFILPLAIVSVLFATYTIFQIYSLHAPKNTIWEKPIIREKDFQNVEIFIKESISAARKNKRITDKIFADIPKTWNDQIITNLCEKKDYGWTIESISTDKKKVGKIALFNVKIRGKSGQSFQLDVIRDGENLYILKASKIEEKKNEHPN